MGDCLRCEATGEKLPMENDTPFENYYSLITARNGSRSVPSNAAELKIASANFWRNKPEITFHHEVRGRC
jgi:hypothetical protein